MDEINKFGLILRLVYHLILHFILLSYIKQTVAGKNWFI